MQCCCLSVYMSILCLSITIGLKSPEWKFIETSYLEQILCSHLYLLVQKGLRSRSHWYTEYFIAVVEILTECLFNSVNVRFSECSYTAELLLEFFSV